LSAVSRSLDGLTDRARRADQIEEQLVQGQTVVSLDTSLIDPSPVPDRMAQSEEEAALFREAIRTSGQNSPILVRPHPKTPGRFEAAFGHRRLRAARELGIAVKAVVRQLSDEELIIAQGQENSARSDLTFIERARFAARLEERGYGRDVIAQALAVDKAQLSKLIAVATRVPTEIIDWIGPAPSYGRDRWQSLAEGVADHAVRKKALRFVETEKASALDTDKRFAALMDALRERVETPKAETCVADDGTRIATVRRTTRNISLQFDDRIAPQFGNYVHKRLEELYRAYRQEQGRGRGPVASEIDRHTSKNNEEH
jgi:ParB family chromosome partitioning protein